MRTERSWPEYLFVTATLLLAALLLPRLARASSTEGFDTEAVTGQARLITAQFRQPGQDLDHAGGGLFGRAPERPGRRPVRSCVSSEGINVNQLAPSIHDLLDFIDHAPSARAATAEFRRRVAAGEVSVAQIDVEHAPIGVMARYAYVPHRRAQTIEVDLTAELAVQFYHELTHSVDPDLPPFYDELDRRWPQLFAAGEAPYESAARRLGVTRRQVSFGDLSAAERVALRRAQDFENDGLFAIEARAFNAQQVMIDELIARVPCYDGYLREQESVNTLRTRYDNVVEKVYCTYGKYPPEVPFDEEPGEGCAVYRRYGGTLPDPR